MHSRRPIKICILKIVSFHTPKFLRGIFPDHLTINSYGLCIGIGIIAAYFIIYYKTKFKGINKDNLSELFLWCFLAAFIGGKLLFYLEDPSKFLSNPALMLKNLGNGFVFYGSLLLVVPTMYFWLRYYKIPFWPFMDGGSFWWACVAFLWSARLLFGRLLSWENLLK